jgi:hypothetical protein
VLLCASHDTGLLVVTDALLKEVGLASQRNVLHEVEGVGRVVVLGVAESQEQTVGDELNVLAHERGVHAEQSARQRVAKEFLLDLNGLGDDGEDRLLAGAVVEEREEEAGEGKTGHETALLEPEDGREGTAEEDTLDGGECDETVGEGGVLVGDPSQSPIGLLADAWDCDALDAYKKRVEG